MPRIETTFYQLIDTLKTADRVLAFGKTGGAALPDDGFSDIDLFVFCDCLPSKTERAALYASVSADLCVSEYGETEDPHWGLVDSLLIGRQEVYPMYFSQDAFLTSIDSILRGERTQRENNYFYPTGRCASILGMHVFFDPQGLISSLKKQCVSYPDALRSAVLAGNLPKIDDSEDFQRAVLRGDVLFYHATIDSALDHFLQALFALNRVYFPSRKRSLDYLRGFSLKPADCEFRLLQALRLGADAETLAESYGIWHQMCFELQLLSGD